MADENAVSLYEYDEAVRTDFPILCGVDEAGRGPLAGDVFAAAVILDPDNMIDGLNDSKKLSEKKREKLFDEIKQKALAYKIAVSTVEEIEEINILNAAMLAMKRAVEGLEITADIVVVDGNKAPDISLTVRTVIKGDATSASVAAASILAKVARDRYMLEMTKLYPQYCFEKHKGYGTKLHTEMILQHGECEIHRPSFLKKLYKNGQ